MVLRATGRPPRVRAAGRPMTMDDVVVRGFMTLAVLVLTAALSWVLVPVEMAAPVLIVALIAEIGIWAFITFGRKANAPLVLAFAAVYGIVVGIISHAYNDLYHGVVFQAVVGTALAFGATSPSTRCASCGSRRSSPSSSSPQVPRSSG